eukprot:9499950-Pyramimonas_sp.AAC.1
MACPTYTTGGSVLNPRLSYAYVLSPTGDPPGSPGNSQPQSEAQPSWSEPTHRRSKPRGPPPSDPSNAPWRYQPLSPGVSGASEIAKPL